jgi:glutamate synthase domain-containing protein 3
VLDVDGDFKRRCNLGMVELGPLDDAEEIAFVRGLVRRHVEHTGSTYAARILETWIDQQPRFVRVMPRDYKRVLLAEARAKAEGREPTFAELVGSTSG